MQLQWLFLHVENGCETIVVSMPEIHLVGPGGVAVILDLAKESLSFFSECTDNTDVNGGMIMHRANFPDIRRVCLALRQRYILSGHGLFSHIFLNKGE